MCTNLTVVTEEHYELGTLYTISLGEVLKSFGFVACIPLLFRMFKPKSRKEKPDDGILDEEFQDDGIQEDSEES